MRKVRSIVSLFLATVIILCGVVSVSATENEDDWASYDWENFSSTEVSDKEWGSMCKWLPTGVDIKLLFDISMKLDGYRSEGMGDVLYKRFRLEPVNLIMALSAEEEAVQEHVICSIICFGIFDRAEFAQFLSNLTLPENAGAGATNILVQMINLAEKAWYMDITNPQTGDSITDFSNIDWSTVDWNTIDLIEWLNHLDEAELKTLFQMTQKCDGAAAEGLANELGNRFKNDPVGLIMALSNEKEEIQTRVVRLIVYNGDYHRAEFEQLVNNLTLPENAGASARNILVQIARLAEETWSMNITNPQTGDSIGFAVLLMAASGLGMAVLLKRRKLPA